MDLVNMKMAPEKKEELKPTAMTDQPEYPWGLQIRLNTEDIKKLGLKELPAIKSEMIVTAKVYVCDVSEHESESGKNQNLGLQITDMSLGDVPKATKTAAEVLYNKEK